MASSVSLLPSPRIQSLRSALSLLKTLPPRVHRECENALHHWLMLALNSLDDIESTLPKLVQLLITAGLSPAQADKIIQHRSPTDPPPPAQEDDEQLFLRYYPRKDIAKDHVHRMFQSYAEVSGGGGMQWGFCSRHFHQLYKFGVRIEGFASPFNSRLSRFPDAAFCSLFPDVDRPFGSLGDFFASFTKLSESPHHLQVNPPFVELVLDRAAAMCLKLLELETTKPRYIFFHGPYWPDAAFYQRLRAARYVLEVRLEANTFYLETPWPERKTFLSRRDNVYFCLSNQPIPDAVRRLLQDPRQRPTRRFSSY